MCNIVGDLDCPVVFTPAQVLSEIGKKQKGRFLLIDIIIIIRISYFITSSYSCECI